MCASGTPASPTTGRTTRNSSSSRTFSSNRVGFGKTRHQRLLVHRPGAIPRKIDGHVEKPVFPEPPVDRIRYLRFEQARDLLLSDLDARDPFVDANAELPETEPPKDLFARLHPPQLFRGDRRTVREPRGEAGERPLVRGGKPEMAAERPDVPFRDPVFQQRAAHAQFLRRPPSGAEVAGVVAVRAVAHRLVPL